MKAEIIIEYGMVSEEYGLRPMYQTVWGDLWGVQEQLVAIVLGWADSIEIE